MMDSFLHLLSHDIYFLDKQTNTYTKPRDLLSELIPIKKVSLGVVKFILNSDTGLY